MEISQQKTHPFIASSEIVKNICSPLLRELRLRCFSHFRMNRKRCYTGVISDANWAEKYITNDLQNYDIISFNTEGFERQCVVWSKERLHKRIQKIRRLAYEQNLSEGITLFIRNGEFFDFFGFAAENDHAKVNEVLTNNIEILIRFCFFYMDEVRKNKNLLEIYSNWQMLKKLEHRNDFCYRSNGDHYDHLNEYFSTKRFYVNIAGNDVYFTAAQMKSLALLFQQKTAKEIAYSLGLSHRTVQEHFDKIREKVNAASISELYSILLKNDYIRLYCHSYK